MVELRLNSSKIQKDRFSKKNVSMFFKTDPKNGQDFHFFKFLKLFFFFKISIFSGKYASLKFGISFDNFTVFNYRKPWVEKFSKIRTFRIF